MALIGSTLLLLMTLMSLQQRRPCMHKLTWKSFDINSSACLRFACIVNAT